METHHIVQTIEALVRLESPTTDKAAVDRCGALLERMLAGAGGSVERITQRERGDHLLARFAGPGGAPIMILGHFDTVWPVGTLAHMPVKREGDRLYGPGTFDMKGGIAIALAAIDAVHAGRGPQAPIVVVLTTDEEIGSATSRAFIEEEARTCRAVLVLEPALPGGALKTARKGCGEFELIVDGIAAHAGLDPGKGASAIHELAAQIRVIEQLQDLANGVSVNVGVVSGGTRPNVIAERASAVIDARAPTREAAKQIESAIRNLQPVRAGTRLTINGGFDRPAMERTPASRELFARARAVASSLGRPLDEGSAGGGSDGNFTAAVGVPTLDGLGAVGDGAHAAHEHVDIPSLAWRAALVAGLLVE